MLSEQTVVGQGGTLLKSSIKQECILLLLGFQNLEFGVFVLVCRIHLHFISLCLCGLIVICVALHAPLVLLSVLSFGLFL